MRNYLDFFSFSSKGYDGQVVHIEADVRPGFPGFDIIGLPDAAIKEARERVRAALRYSGFKFPTQRVLVSLSPASIPKSGSLLDLGIALAILFAARKRKNEEPCTSGPPRDSLAAEKSRGISGHDSLQNKSGAPGLFDTNYSVNPQFKAGKIKILAAGELSLDGRIVQDYSAIGAVEAAKKTGCALCIVPESSPGGKGVIRASSLTEAFLRSGEYLDPDSINAKDLLDSPRGGNTRLPVFSDIIGLWKEKEILTLCAAGRHSVLLFGPPGVGKTLLTTRIAALLPELDDEELSRVQRIYGCTGIDKTDYRPPERLLPHDVTLQQFNLGNAAKSPGEGALAHGGVLILDEVDAYKKRLLDGVKEAYDSGFTASCQNGETVRYPARFIMVASMNACACSRLGSPNEACICTQGKILSHWNKIGAPLISRFDIRHPVEPQNLAEAARKDQKPDSFYTDKIHIADERQKHRFKDSEDIKRNGEVHIRSFKGVGIFSRELDLYSRVLKDNTSFNTREVLSIVSLARTIADTEDRADITAEDLKAALSFKKYGEGDYYWKTIR